MMAVLLACLALTAATTRMVMGNRFRGKGVEVLSRLRLRRNGLRHGEVWDEATLYGAGWKMSRRTPPQSQLALCRGH